MWCNSSQHLKTALGWLYFHTGSEDQDNKEHAYKMARLLLFVFFVAFMGFTAEAVLFGKVG